jgi:hypothetical protein
MNWTVWYLLPQWLVFVVNIGAVHRLSRVIARDTLLERPRNFISNKYHGMLVNLMLCMWCLTFWFAIVAVLLTSWDWSHKVWLVIASILTVADIAGYMSERA